MSAETEFDKAEKTPAEALMTAREKRIAFGALRTAVKATVPLLPKFALVVGPVLALLLAAAQHWVGKAETEHKIAVGYGTLAPVSNTQAAEIAQLQKDVAQLAESNALQARLLLASRPGFDDKGKPEPGPAKKKRRGRVVAPPADPTIVKQVQDDATKNQVLNARLAVEKPAVPAVPEKLPPEVPKGPEWPPPVPPQTAP